MKFSRVDPISACQAKNLAASLALGALFIAGPVLAEQPTGAFGFNGTVSGFPTGAVTVTGGGAYRLADGFVHSGGGFRCLADVHQGPLSTSINPDSPGPCLAGEGVRWDTAGLLTSVRFKCTGALGESFKTVNTSDKTVILQGDFYRAGNGDDESFTAQMIISETEIAPNDFPGANMWVQGVGCGKGVVSFR